MCLLGCLTLTVQNEVCVEFDSRWLSSHSSAEGGKFFCVHRKSHFKTSTYEHERVMWKLLQSPVHIHCPVVKLFNKKIFAYL